MAAEALVPPDAARVVARVATVYTNAPERLRETISANLCTLLRPPPMSARATGRGHGSHDVDGPMTLVMPGRSDLRPTPPGRRRNHQPTRTHEAHWLGLANCRAIPNCGKAIWQLIQPDLIVLSRYEQSRRINEVEKTSRELDLTGARERASVLSGGERQRC